VIFLVITIKTLKKVKLKKPILVVGLPGVGNVGRVAAGYMAAELKMKKIAEIYSTSFLPIVLLDDEDVVRLLRCEVYYLKAKRDIIVLTGDTQSTDTKGHYEFSNAVLDYAKKLGIKELITLGGFSEGVLKTDPRVVAAVSNNDVKKKYKKFKIDFGKDHPVGTITGASGLLVAMAEDYKMSGMVLMGETMGMPLIMDPKAADAILHTLVRILGIKLDLNKLEKTVKEMEERLKKTEDIHKKLLEDIPKSKEDVRYIG
jgi:uncharacterized protein